MIVNVAIDPSGSYLAAAGSDKCIFIHDAVTGDRLASLSGHSGIVIDTQNTWKMEVKFIKTGGTPVPFTL